MREENTKKLKNLYDFAKAEKSSIQATLTTAYEFLAPGNTLSPDTKKLYDASTARELNKSAKKRFGQLFPSFQNWIEVNLKDSDGNYMKNNGFSELLAKKSNSAVRASNFHLEVPNAILDSLISTGAVLVRAGDSIRPIQFQAINWQNLYPVENDDGVIGDVFLKQTILNSQIKSRYPDAKIGKDLLDKIKDKPQDKHVVIECYTKGDGDTTDLTVFVGENFKDLIFTDSYNYQPVVAFRSDKVAGKSWGWGVGLEVLPDTKTLNKVRELILKNASVALSGIWQADDDGVLNTAQVKLVPGAIIPKAVGSAGLQPLHTGRPFDIGELATANLQAEIKKTILGETLPVKSDRSTATEWQVRMAERRETEIPASMRLLSEMFYPLVNAIFNILQDPVMADTEWFVKNDSGAKIVAVPANPIARIETQMRASEELEFVGQLMQAFPQAMGQIIDVDAFLRRQLDANDVSSEIIISPEVLEQQQVMASQAVASDVEQMEQMNPADLMSGVE